MILKKIISGGLTVSDQAALDTAIRLGVAHGGYIPWGRMAEIGTLPLKYKLHELNTDNQQPFKINGEIVSVMPDGTGVKFKIESQMQESVLKGFVDMTQS